MTTSLLRRLQSLDRSQFQGPISAVLCYIEPLYKDQLSDKTSFQGPISGVTMEVQFILLKKHTPTNKKLRICPPNWPDKIPRPRATTQIYHLKRNWTYFSFFWITSKFHKPEQFPLGYKVLWSRGACMPNIIGLYQIVEKILIFKNPDIGVTPVNFLPLDLMQNDPNSHLSLRFTDIPGDFLWPFP